MTEAVSPRVFVSYSWTDQDHIDWVVSLAERLVNDGIDVVLDLWEFKEGHDKYVFMERMVKDPTVTHVIAICDQLYADKADGRQGGVGTESQIISKSVYESVTQEKFVPVIRERDQDGKECVPIYFQNRKYIDFSDDDTFPQAYDTLIRVILGKPERKKPPLGKIPAHLLMDGVPLLKTAPKLDRLKHAVTSGKPHGQALLGDYCETFIAAMDDFKLLPSSTKEPFDEALLRNIASLLPYRDNFVELMFFVSQFMDNQDTYDQLVHFLEDLLTLQSKTESSNTSCDNYRFLVNEIFLYLLAILIKSRRYAAAAYFIESPYTFHSSQYGQDFHQKGNSAFCGRITTLDEARNRRLKTNFFSIAADTMRDRPHPRISFMELVQADLLLFVRPYFPQPQAAGRWYPRTALWYAKGSLELFVRANTEQGIVPLKAILRISTPKELVNHLRAALGTKNSILNIEWAMQIHWEELFNLNVLERL